MGLQRLRRLDKTGRATKAVAEAWRISMFPKFLYFDLGNVILNFSHRKACEQMGDLAGISPDLVWETIFASGLEQRLEAGEITDRQFYDHFCQVVGKQPDYEKLR